MEWRELERVVAGEVGEDDRELFNVMLGDFIVDGFVTNDVDNGPAVRRELVDTRVSWRG